MEKDLIEMFRDYSELSGGPFPDALDMASLLTMVMTKKLLSMLQRSRRSRVRSRSRR